jgi:hypothetical protein
MSTAPDANPAGPSSPPVWSEQAPVSASPDLQPAMAPPAAPGEGILPKQQTATAEVLAGVDPGSGAQADDGLRELQQELLGRCTALRSEITALERRRSAPARSAAPS